MTEPTTTADTTFEKLREPLGLEDDRTKSYVQSLLWALEGTAYHRGYDDALKELDDRQYEPAEREYRYWSSETEPGE